TVTDFVLDGADHANYALSTVSATTTGDIMARELTVSLSADPLITKVYDGSDAATLATDNYELSGILTGETVTVSGTTLYRDKNAGTNKEIWVKDFELGGVDAANYSITTTSTTTTGSITARPLVVSLDASPLITKVYDGTPTATLTAGNYRLDGVIGNDDVTASGSAVYDSEHANKDKTITLAELLLDGNDAGNYTLTTTSGSTTGSITQRPLMIAAAMGQGKQYGEKDPVLAYEATGFAKVEDQHRVVGELSRIPGEDVRTYAIGIGTLTAGPNYTLDYIGADFTITPQTLTVTPDREQGKVYGENDSTLTYTVSGWQFDDSEAVLIGSLSREAGEDAGAYAINGGDLSAGINYTITQAEEVFHIHSAELTVTADGGQHKVYGSDDSVLTYNVTGFKRGDDERIFSGALSRVRGETPGVYGITQGTLAANGNYTVNYSGADFTIQRKPLTVVVNNYPAITKVYDANNAATLVAANYRLEGLVHGSDVTVSGTAVYRDINAGTDKEVWVTDFELGGADAANYSIIADTEVMTTGEITPKLLTVSVNTDSPITKIYDGTPTATLAAGHYRLSGIVDADLITVSGTAKYDDSNAGTEKIVTVTDLKLAGPDVSNYILTAVSAITEGRIMPRPLTVTVTAGQGKVYGSDDPALTFEATGFEGDDDERILMGGLERVRGEDVGTYAITQGTLDAGTNYTVDYIGSGFRITPLDVTVTVDGQTKVFGQSDPGLTYGVSPALVGGDGFRGALVREPGEAVGTYAINQGTLALSSNYTLTYNGAELEIKTSSTLTVAFEDRSFVYDGTAKSLSIEGELPAGTSVSYTGNGRTKVGSQTVTATIDGGANYEGLVLTATLDITPGMRTLRFPVLGPKTYGDVDFTPAATASSGEAITYTSSNPAVAEIGDSGLIRIVGAGEAEITATVPENSNYANRPEMSRVLAVGKAMQAITFTAPVEVNRAVGSLQLDVRTSSGLPVYLAIDDGQVATVGGTMLHIHRLGTINITAAQAGDGNHEAAEPVTVTLRVVDPASDFPVRVHPAVSPNGDGINEFLMIEGIRDYPDNRVSVANRNGTIVWEASGYDNDRIAFRGIGPGQQKLPAGTYFYVVEIGTGGGTEYRQGYFVLRY
ncbi:MAG TPA: MBG domain-containing protein, partial [Parapedobacter sp.]|uniref:MBG domain-containing protein n=1 Tax=Parapedobacter sp. TaxID=1958893 RepID=UPI002C22FD12